MEPGPVAPRETSIESLWQGEVFRNFGDRVTLKTFKMALTKIIEFKNLRYWLYTNGNYSITHF